MYMFWHFLIPTFSLLNSALVSSFLRLGCCRLLLISLMLSNLGTQLQVFFFFLDFPKTYLQDFQKTYFFRYFFQIL